MGLQEQIVGVFGSVNLLDPTDVGVTEILGEEQLPGGELLS